MKKKALGILAVLVIVFLAVLIIRIVSGAFSLLSGTLNTLLGIVILISLLLIVLWMFLYAKHK